MKRNLMSGVQRRSRSTFLKCRAPCATARFPAAIAQLRQPGPPTATPPAMWEPRRCRRLATRSNPLPIGSVQSRQARVHWPPISPSGRWRQQDQPPAACIRRNMIAVAVWTFDTSLLSKPTTGVHQFGGGPADRNFTLAIEPRRIALRYAFPVIDDDEHVGIPCLP